MGISLYLSLIGVLFAFGNLLLFDRANFMLCSIRPLAHVQLRWLSKYPFGPSSESSQRRSLNTESRNTSWLRPGVMLGIPARVRTAFTAVYASAVGPLFTS